MLTRGALFTLLLVTTSVPWTWSLTSGNPTHSLTCPPGEESSRYTIACVVLRNSTISNITWSRVTDESGRTVVALCDVGKPVCSLYYKHFSATLKENLDGFISTLTLEALSRHATHHLNAQWECRAGEAHHSTCDLEIFHKPTKPICQAPEVAYDKSGTPIIAVECSTAKTFPSASCKFFTTKLDGNEVQMSGSLSYTLSIFEENNTEYYRLTCKTSQNISHFGEGLHKFRVVMTPKIEGGDKYSATSEYTDPLDLSYPTVSLGPECFESENVTEGYIRQGATAFCKCQIEKPGIPPGRALWYTKVNGVYHQIDNDLRHDSDVLKVEWKNNHNVTSKYWCFGTSSLFEPMYKISEGKSYFPRPAVTPTNVVVRTSVTDALTVCKDTEEIHVTCSLPANDEPKGLPPLFSISLNGKREVALINGSLEGNQYTLTRTFKRSPVGDISVTCRAEHFFFKDMSEEKTVVIKVIKPPPTFPIIEVNEGIKVQGPQFLTVCEGQALRVSCYVKGGIPIVSDVTLKWDQDTTEVKQEKFANLTFTAARSMTGLQLMCFASHISDCYEKSTVLTLNVTYPPELMSFSISSSTEDLDVSENELMAFSCRASGHPIPLLSILQRRPLDDDVERVVRSQEGHILDMKKPAQCHDSGIYSCQVRAHLTTDIEESALCDSNEHGGNSSSGREISGNSIESPEKDGMEGNRAQVADPPHETGQSSQKQIRVNVICPLRKKNKEKHVKKFLVEPGGNLTTSVRVVGHPPPTSFVLQFIPHRRDDKAVSLLIPSARYMAGYHPSAHATGDVQLTLINVTLDFAGMYTLLITNRLDQGFEFVFEIFTSSVLVEDDKDSAQVLSPGLIGVASTVGVVLILIFIVLVYKTCFHPDPPPQPNQIIEEPPILIENPAFVRDERPYSELPSARNRATATTNPHTPSVNKIENNAYIIPEHKNEASIYSSDIEADRSETFPFRLDLQPHAIQRLNNAGRGQPNGSSPKSIHSGPETEQGGDHKAAGDIDDHRHSFRVYEKSISISASPYNISPRRKELLEQGNNHPHGAGTENHEYFYADAITAPHRIDRARVSDV